MDRVKYGKQPSLMSPPIQWGYNYQQRLLIQIDTEEEEGCLSVHPLMVFQTEQQSEISLI